MDCKVENIVKIVTGSDKSFTVTLIDEDTKERVDLTLATAGTIYIKNGVGAFVSKALTLPPTDPKLGAVTIDLTPAETDQLDEETTSFELELTIDGKTHIYLGENLLEVKKRLYVA